MDSNGKVVLSPKRSSTQHVREKLKGKRTNALAVAVGIVMADAMVGTSKAAKSATFATRR